MTVKRMLVRCDDLFQSEPGLHWFPHFRHVRIILFFPIAPAMSPGTPPVSTPTPTALPSLNPRLLAVICCDLHAGQLIGVSCCSAVSLCGIDSQGKLKD